MFHSSSDQPDETPLASGCSACTGHVRLGFEFTMAFQPIVNTTTRQIFAHEALVRGVNNESAGQILAQVNDSNRYQFDQACRVCAVQLAAQLGMNTFLSINFMPNAVYNPETCIRTTMEASKRFNFPLDQIIFEITEGEKVTDLPHLQGIIQEYKRRGFQTAIDDFGAGYSGLNVLAELATDLIKLDMMLIRDIHQDRKRQVIVKAIAQVCRDLEITPIAEGVETYEELRTLQDFGIELFQGYYFARPSFQSLATLSQDQLF